MRVVGSAAGINIHAPEDAYFSYFNSPYVGHDIGTAIDIYPRHQEWDGPVTTPVSGTITLIKKMRMGRLKEFPTHEFDYGIGIKPEESESNIVRIMHCKPTVSEGETINLGDPIGEAIRSRYFNYWTGPHYHVEILPTESFRRSSKSHQLVLDYQLELKRSNTSFEEIEYQVSSVNEDHIIGYAENLGHASIGDLVGLPATNGERELMGILDGGLSHYKIGGVIGTSDPQQGKQVYLADSSVGTVRNAKSGVCIFRRGPSITSYLDNIELRGLSCFIYSKHYAKNMTPQLILIPKRYGQLKGQLNEGDVCILRIDSDNNTVKADQI